MLYNKYYWLSIKFTFIINLFEYTDVDTIFYICSQI
jgi:hypothetical protein